MGQFSIYRPKISVALAADTTPSFFMGYKKIIFPGIQLGGDGDPRTNGYHAMAYSVTYDTTNAASGIIYSGEGGIVQLVTANYSPPCTWIFSDWRLDGGTIFYNDKSESIDPYNPSPSFRQVNFSDSPNLYQLITPLWVIASFQDYCMFKPDGDGIFVTLGIVTWSCDGELSKIPLGSPGFPGYTIITNTVVGPNGPDNSDQLPVWNKNIPQQE